VNKFIWTDLSTYKLKESVEFYSELLNWKFQNDNDYFVGGANGIYEVGIYETPEFFQKINMPHFWMNYIHVESLKDTTAKAIELGGKIELNNEPFYGGTIALIRDPMGAGFTIYQGKELDQKPNTKSISIGMRELHTSNAKLNIGFYENLFNWQIKVQSDSIYTISEESGNEIGRILELDNSIKGRYEYWVTEFMVDNLHETRERLKILGGVEILNEGSRILASDKFKEAFFYLSSK